jgi:hypothetical protein
MANSQMTTSFFMLRPAKGREMNHSQMTTSFFHATKLNAGFSILVFKQKHAG